MRLELFNRQRTVPVETARLEALAENAASACVPYLGGGLAVLTELQAVEVSIVSDRRIAQVHRRFLQVPGPTDVITFEHGEIFVSATTAARQAILEYETTERELARYIVHGLLHLNGHLDKDPAAAATMWQAQEHILESLWPRG